MDVNLGWDWRSHQPMIHLIMTLVQPKLVLELGMGDYSTPLFLQYTPDEYIGIENNRDWIDRIKNEYDFQSGYTVLYHDLENEDIIISTRLTDLCDKDKEVIVNYYLQIKEWVSDKVPNLLFVDNFTCLRNIAIRVLYKKFDVIIFHDCQPLGMIEYEYDLSGMGDYDFYLLKSPDPWTGCLIRKSFGYPARLLAEQIQPFIVDFCTVNKISIDSVYLEKQA